MRRRFKILGLSAAIACCTSALWVPAAQASIAFVQNLGQVSCGGSTSTSVPVPAGGVAAGNTLILRLELRGTTGGPVGASDSAGNAYSVDADSLYVDQRVTIVSAYVAAPLSAGNNITLTYPSTSSMGVVVDEFSGISATSRLDGSGSGGGNNAAPTATLTTTHLNDLLIGAVGHANLVGWTQPASWTGLTGQTPSCGGGAGGNSTGFGAYRIASAAGPFSYDPLLSQVAGRRRSPPTPRRRPGRARAPAAPRGAAPRGAAPAAGQAQPAASPATSAPSAAEAAASRARRPT